MRRFWKCWVGGLLVVAVACAPGRSEEETKKKPDDPLRVAREHFRKGRYAEAIEACDALEKERADPAALAILRSRALTAEGHWDEAQKTLEAAKAAAPRSAPLFARLGEVRFLRGDYAAAEKEIEQALKLDAKNLAAKLVQADLYTETGRIKEASDGYLGFVRYYNQAQPEDADTLMLVGRGSAQYARWKSVSSVFNFLVNTLCPDALKDDPDCWEALHLSGTLLVEKYNRAQAIPDLKKALAINPHATEVLVTLAEAALQEHDFEEAADFATQALKVDERQIGALCVLADIATFKGNWVEADQHAAKALEVNPHDQRVLARRAAVYLLTDGLPPQKEFDGLLSNLDNLKEIQIENPSRFSQLVMELARRNPRPGYFLAVLGEALAQRRQYDGAERVFRHAVAVMPQLSAPKNELGMLYMRTGQMDDARRLLDDAFKADPYHVRVSNMRKVLKLLDGYGTLQTEHFVIRYDTEADAILARYMAEYLEEIYPALVKQFGYEPEHRTQFELYHKAKGLSAHQWFSARMVGLPWIQTIGASTGVIIALASPTAVDTGFNWARVAKHEFVHVITLQQTAFRIPHWFTEALAVTSEGIARPAKWDELLLERVPKGELRVLDELNDGFQRPKSPDDWQFAYCQSRLYAQYIIETFGDEKIAQMLDGYRRNLTTDEIIPLVFGMKKPEFEKGYRAFLDKIVAEIAKEAGAQADEKSAPLAELEKAHKANREDTKAAGAYAFGLLEAGERKEARLLAEEVIQKEPSNVRAAMVLALLEIRAEDYPAAAAWLQPALKRDSPNRELLKLLAKIQLSEGKNAEAAELYELGRKHYPTNLDFLKGLSQVYEKLNESEKRREVLNRIAERDPDDFASRKAIATMALEAKDFATAAASAREAIFINVLDDEAHRQLGRAYAGLNQPKKAVAEFATAFELQPRDVGVAVELARAQRDAGETAAARKTLAAAKAIDEENEQVQALAKELDAEKP